MSDARVRIYNGHDGESNILGFSAHAVGVEDNPEFTDFLHKNGYSWSEVTDTPEASVSWGHLEIRPPLKDQHLQAFRSLVLRVVDSGHNNTWLIDNRNVLPDRPLGAGEYILEDTAEYMPVRIEG